MMKIAFIVEFPTQFEVPFYQYVDQWIKEQGIKKKDGGFDSPPTGRTSAQPDKDVEFHVIYNNTDQKDYLDAELGKNVGWGFNLYEGYTFFIADQQDIVNSVSAILDLEHYDFIILNGYKNSYQGLVTICKERNIPIALRIDAVGYHLSPLQRWLRLLYLPYAYRHFNHFFAVGSATRTYLNSLGIPNQRISYFSYATDDAWFARQSQDQDAIQSIKTQWGIKAERIILSVAKFVPRESPWDLIKAFVALNDPSLALVLVGDGAERADLENFAQQYPQLCIYFTGYVPYQQLPYYYGMSAIFVHPAQHEPWGVSVQEALACGCAVVASDKVGAAKDLIEEGKNGFIYPLGNTLVLSSKIRLCLLLDAQTFKSSTDAILKKWNYSAMWKEIRQAALSYNS